MTDRVTRPRPEPTASDEASATGPKPPPRHSRSYGVQPPAEGSSGRRARLRHPARGAPRK
jgi:hypothetical protein